jgi:superfamily II DNA or RNA helicase
MIERPTGYTVKTITMSAMSVVDPAAELRPLVTVFPSGALRVDLSGDAHTGLSAAARARVAAAFDRGVGYGLLDLGTTEVDTALSPDLAFLRDLGRAFVTRLRAVPELEERRERVEVDCPADECARLAGAVPPMPGAELVDAEWLAARWAEIGRAFSDEIRRHRGPLGEWLRRRHPSWQIVGKVCLHLAENRGDDEHPFAFLATYALKAGAAGRIQHRPLARAVDEARGDRQTLLHLLVPLQRAAEGTDWLAELIDSGEVYQPLAWTPDEALRFLRAVPAFEAAGLAVRVPDWWRSRRRPEVAVRIGDNKPSGLGTEALLDFSVGVALGGETLTAAEVRDLLGAADGLVRVRGQWVELDSHRLREVLDHWTRVEREAGADGVSFLEGMRLLSGAAAVEADGDTLMDDGAQWSRVEAGEWFAETLAGLRGPAELGDADPGTDLRGALRPYQKVGVSWLRFASSLRLGVCLADDMGLGKTVQVIALLLLHKRHRRDDDPPHLLVVPASLIANWQSELERFAPSLSWVIAHPSVMSAQELAELHAAPLAGVDLVITTYGTLSRSEALRSRAWWLAILDEAQAIKNPGTRQTRAVKALRARARVALTGTPVENRLGDLWSIFDFLDPGLLGSSKEFSAFAKKLAERRAEPFAPLRRLVQPYILRRLKTDRAIVADLPDKTEVKAFCLLSNVQAALYQQAVNELEHAIVNERQGMKRRGLILSYLMRFKQICNHPSHWLGDGRWDEPSSGKLARLREIVEAVAATNDKVLVFTQFREATEPLAAFLSEIFGRPGLILHGTTPVAERGALVKRFQNDPAVPFFVLSLKAGGVGLNLTAAAHVVHFDRWWNPAVEDQATDRAYRIGQHRNVLVHKLVCRGTVEERIDRMIEDKQALARGVLAGGAETLLTELSNEDLMSLVSLDLTRATVEDA